MKDLDLSLPAHLADLAAMPIEQLGRALWKGKVFFRSLADPALIDGPTPPDGASDCGTLKK